jgi:hypothetical protein
LAGALGEAAHIGHELTIHASAVSVSTIHVPVVVRVLNHRYARLSLKVIRLPAGAGALGQASVLGIKLAGGA